MFDALSRFFKRRLPAEPPVEELTDAEVDELAGLLLDDKPVDAARMTRIAELLGQNSEETPKP